MGCSWVDWGTELSSSLPFGIHGGAVSRVDGPPVFQRPAIRARVGFVIPSSAQDPGRMAVVAAAAFVGSKHCVQLECAVRASLCRQGVKSFFFLAGPDFDGDFPGAYKLDETWWRCAGLR